MNEVGLQVQELHPTELVVRISVYPVPQKQSVMGHLVVEGGGVDVTGLHEHELHPRELVNRVCVYPDPHQQSVM